MDAQRIRPRFPRIERLIRLTALVCERRKLSLLDLTQQFCVTRRTAMRDLKSLRDAGMHIIFFPGEDHYRLIDVELPVGGLSGAMTRNGRSISPR